VFVRESVGEGHLKRGALSFSWNTRQATSMDAVVCVSRVYLSRVYPLPSFAKGCYVSAIQS
jgi:hypothetical protein